MEFKDFEEWLIHFYNRRGWTDTTNFQKLGFLFEEVGELAQAIRLYEIRKDSPDSIPNDRHRIQENLYEELGDLLANVIIIANNYNISLDELINKHKHKLLKRFGS
ncbi:MazG-like family protein [Brevibacillus laterosporus]|uniref:MazG-like family protein n=1 Tax=Brevibacillus laterosporus TaxID=1465 RepID=UPI002E1AEE2F|nr:MazG-like family protein [Brevibacillus laterosporus]